MLNTNIEFRKGVLFIRLNGVLDKNTMNLLDDTYNLIVDNKVKNIVFNNMGIEINGPYKKGITIKNNTFMNGNYTREKRADGEGVRAQRAAETGTGECVLDHPRLQ